MVAIIVQIALKHNFISCLLVITGGVMALHYTILVRVFAGCPVVVCLGPAETGKSRLPSPCLVCILFIQMLTMLTQCDLRFGQQDHNCQRCMRRAQNAFFLEWAAISTLSFSIDDPPQVRSGSSLDINDLIVDLYNDCKTAHLRKGSLEPHSTPIVATNFNLDSDQRYSDHLAS